MKIKELIQQFESATLPKDKWGHFCHIRVALYYLFHEQSIYEAITKMRCGLIRYGALRNPPIICSERYHETITLFWMYELNKFMESNPDKSFEELELLLEKSELTSKEYILKFYSEKIFDSKKARATYVPPRKK